MSIIDVPFSDFPARLQSSEIPKVHQEFILSKLSGNYPFVSVIITDNSGTLELTIDEFLYDEWTNPTEQTTGKSPHGCRTIYQWDSKKWVSEFTTEYGG